MDIVVSHGGGEPHRVNTTIVPLLLFKIFTNAYNLDDQKYVECNPNPSDLSAPGAHMECTYTL